MIILNIKKVNDGYLIDFGLEEIIVDEFTLIKFNLYKGKEINDLSEIKESIKYEIELKRAKEFLKKPKTEYEVRCFLNDYKDEIINKLKDSYLINDSLYAFNYKNKMESKRIGKNNILNDLRKVKISEEILSTLEFDKELENIRYYIEHTKTNKSERILKENLRQKLINKGFSNDDINELIIDLKSDDSNQIKIDLEKALRKYKDYSGNELKNRIIKYLLQKGYSYDLINSTISSFI